MIEDFEIEAILKGGQFGGEYLDSIGKTDLCTLTAEEWQIFLTSVCTNFLTARAAKAPLDDSDIPF